MLQCRAVVAVPGCSAKPASRGDHELQESPLQPLLATMHIRFGNNRHEQHVSPIRHSAPLPHTRVMASKPTSSQLQGRNADLEGDGGTENKNGRWLVGRLLGFIQLGYGFSVLVVGAFWIGVGVTGMGTVSLVRPELMYPPGEVGVWSLMVGLMAAGFAACTAPKSSSGRPPMRIDVVQLCAAVSFVCLLLMFLPFVSGMEFIGPEDQCIYGDCFPRPYQELLLAAPALAAAASMTVCAFLGPRMRWWLRALVPAVIFIGASAVQLAIWDSVVLPFLGGPSPFSI